MFRHHAINPATKPCHNLHTLSLLPDRQVVKNMGSTLGACGDVNRNVMSPPAPFKNRPDYAACEQ